jgi:hypothetical protein
MLMTVQVTKLPLYCKISTRGMMCIAKPELTEDLYVVQKQEFSVHAICMYASIFIRDKPIL